jgi:hypothetical protein
VRKAIKATLASRGNRLRDLDGAADYLQIGRRSVERLIELGKLPVIKLPVSRRGPDETTARVLVDTLDLDRLIDASREVRGGRG